MGDEFGTVVRQDRLVAGHAGEHALASSGETGEEMRLDEALRHQQVCPDRESVEDKFSSGRKHAY